MAEHVNESGADDQRHQRTTRYRSLARYPVRQWRTFFIIGVLSVVSAASAALQPWPLKILADYALGHAPVPDPVTSLLDVFSLDATGSNLVLLAAVATLALFVAATLLDAGLAMAWTYAGQRMLYDLAADMFARLQRLSLLFHSSRSVGDLLTRLTGDTWALYTVVEGGVISPVQQVLTFATIGVVAFRLDPVLAAVSFVLAPITAVLARFFGTRLRQRVAESRQAQSRLVSFAHQTLLAIPVVQAFSTERRNVETFDRLADEAVVATQRGVAVRSAFSLTNSLVGTGGLALVTFVGTRRVLSGDVSIGELLVFLSYVRTLQTASQNLLTTYTDVRAAGASLDRVLEVLETKQEVADRAGAVTVSRMAGAVELVDVSFGYEPGRAVLEHVSLQAAPGQTIALVGRTGAGKSTLVSLIPRFYDPWHGTVTIDGADIRDLTLTSLRAQISVVLQDPFLLPLSIRDNIAYSHPDATADDVELAARTANAHDFITALPDGYNTVIGERGATLSGGERQRVAIARALLKDAPILILDEPTSALDAETEASLLEALERLMHGRTTFIIAHRLSTVRKADRIVVIEHGHITETGTHEQLLTTGGTYQHLHELQTGTTTAPEVVLLDDLMTIHEERGG